jgi:hypothetical protein
MSMTTRRNIGGRCGWTLIELVATMVAGAVLMNVTISAVAALRRADERFSLRANERRSMTSLVDRLRSDIHAASGVSWDEEANRLTMTSPAGGRVIYELANRRWERRVSDDAAGKLQLAGAYRAPRGLACRVSPSSASEGSPVHMAWAATRQPHNASRSASPPRELIAEVGRDLSLLHE